MQITEQFTVSQPIDDVWKLFTNVPEVARCLPGAELTADNGDGTYDGSVSVKLGPISASFAGTATVTLDEPHHASKIKGRGVDRAGGSQGTVDVDVQLTAIDGPATDVTIDAKVNLAGPVAQFGRTGLVNEVSRRLIDEFSECLHAKLEADSESEAADVEASDVKGLSLGVAALWSAFANWLRKIFSGGRD